MAEGKESERLIENREPWQETPEPGQSENQSENQVKNQVEGNRDPHNDNSWYHRTEKMLFLYPTIDSAIAHQESILKLIEINMFPTGVAKYRNDGPPSTDDVVSSSEKYAEKRITSRDRVNAKIERLRAQKAVVEAVVARLGSEEMELVQKWYFEDWKLKRPDRKIWKELNIGKVTFWRQKDRVVKKIAEWIGETTHLYR